MVRGREAVIGGLLVLSVALNVLLLLRRESSSTSTLEDAAPRAQRECADNRPLSIVGDRDECFSLRKRLADLETKYQLGRPMSERFETLSRVQADEDRTRRLLANVFSDPEHYELECREQVCRISVDHTDAPKDWQVRMQNEPALQGQFSQMEFSAGVVTVELQNEASAAATQLWLQVATAMGESSALKSCKQSNPAPAGEVTITLALVAPRRLEATVAGSLASHAVGVCMRRVMDELLRQIEVPTAVTTIPEHPFTIKVP